MKRTLAAALAVSIAGCSETEPPPRSAPRGAPVAITAEAVETTPPQTPAPVEAEPKGESVAEPMPPELEATLRAGDEVVRTLAGLDEPRLDTSTRETYDSSTERIIEGMSEQEQKAFAFDLLTVVFAHARLFGPDADSDGPPAYLHGKTAADVRAMADEIRSRP